MDETYIKVHGHWVYLSRTVDKAGPFLSRNRDRKRREILSPQRDEEHSRAHEDHPGCLGGLGPRCVGDASRRRTSWLRRGSIQPVLEQLGRAGPSESEATNSADAGLEALRQQPGPDLLATRVGC
jgi:hypothetical protein